MTIRVPVSSLQNKWFDAQTVDEDDLNVEQSHNTQSTSSIVQNFFGSGVLLESPLPRVIFDTDILDSIQAALLAAGNFDGAGINPILQPSDPNEGNQLTVELSGSTVFGRYSSKVLIIGLSFDGQLIMDKFFFHKNETQTTKNHYVKILTVMFNDFLGNNNCSRNWEGRIIIRETLPFEISRDPKSSSQDYQPDLFFRDFKVSDPNYTLFETLQVAIGPEYDVDSLNINTTGIQPHRSIVSGDVTTQIGEKFLTTTDNIQKITLLLGVEKNVSAPVNDWFNWNGDLVISLYPLQTTVDCPTDIIPELMIEFEPEPRPVVEISLNQSELRSLGYTLTDIAQPVDFVFSNTVISQPGGVKKNSYYEISIKRSGANNLGTLFVEVGVSRETTSRLTMFSGSWVDVADQDLWYQVWSDSAKFATGMAYDAGVGVMSTKTVLDETNGSTKDNQQGFFSFVSTGESINNTAIVQAISKESYSVQDERTGNPVFSRQQFEPSFSFVTNDTLSQIKKTAEPLILGCVSDINPKSNVDFNFEQNYPGLAKGNSFTIINPGANLLSLRLLGSKLLPDNICATFEYRIFKSILCTDGYGDVNGDGYITQEDVTRAAELIGLSINNPTTQQLIVDGYVSTLEILRADVNGDGYVSSDDVNLIQEYVDRKINTFPVGTSFTHLQLLVQPSVGRSDGYFDCDGYIRDGYSTIDPSTLLPIELEYYGNPIRSNIDGDNPVVWNSIPFNPVECTIEFQPFWQDWLLGLAAKARELPVSFTYPESISKTACASSAMFNCSDRAGEKPACDSGRNDFYVPGNLILGSGELLRPDGSAVKSDIEYATIIFELPLSQLAESSIDIFRSFIADRGDGFTNSSYLAAKYYDCTFVQQEDLALNKVRFDVSIQSFVKNIDGYTVEDGYGIIDDNLIGVFMDHSTGILKLTARDNENNPYFRTLVSRIQVIAALKKSGWNNQILTINQFELENLSTPSLLVP